MLEAKTVNRCKGCGGELTQKDGEICCRQCGLVVETVFNPQNKIPMNQTRSPTCSLDTSKSLGSLIGYKNRGLYSVQAINYGEGAVVPIHQIKVLTQRHKHPIIEKMDFYGSQLMKKWLNSVVGKESNISKVFANKLGDTINKVGLRLALIDDGRKARRMTEVCFLWVWIKMKLPNADKLRVGLWPQKGGVPEIREVTRVLNQTP